MSMRVRNTSCSPFESHDRERPRMTEALGNVCEEFSRETTLHGLRYIFDRNAFAVRRLIWLFLTLLCTTILTYQIVERVTYFYDSPITVNFRVNYNQSLEFPAVTICNQNAFRATAANKYGWYRLIEYMYRNGSQAESDAWDSVDGANFTIDNLFYNLGHSKEDFIVRCEWLGESCSADNFTTSITDHGICYTFNKVSVNKHMLYVSSSGVEHGLRLTINVEKYDAMPGPHEATSIKILNTDQSDFPRVEEIGNAISTGAHAFIGLGVLVINNLPKPHGDCGERSLLSTRRYTTEMCNLECVTKYVKKRCGCRHIFMPDIDGNLPVCTVRQYFQCFTEAHAYIHKRIIEFCDCPTSCNYRLYEPSISYATTSDYFKQHLIDIAKHEHLKARFFEARETTSRMDNAEFQKFNYTVQETATTLDSLKSVLIYDIQERLVTQMSVLQEVVNNMTRALHEKDVIYRYQRYSIQKNFMRARDAMEERTLNKVCLGFHEFVFDAEFKLRKLEEAMRNNSTDAGILYLLLRNVLESKVETTNRAHANYTQLYDSYGSGEVIFNYKFENHARKENPFIVPKPLMNESLIHNGYARRYAPRVGRDIERVMNSTLAYQDLVDECYKEPACVLDFQRMQQISKEFIDACEDFFHSKSTFYFESIDRPLRIIQERIEAFATAELEYSRCRDSLQAALDGLNDSLRHIREQFLGDLTDNVESAIKYFGPTDEHNITKLELAERFTSSTVGDQLHTMQIFFNALRQRGGLIYQKWTELKDKYLKLWDIILNDQDSVTYYNYKNIKEFLRDYTDMEGFLHNFFDSVRDDNDLRFAIGNVDNLFIKAIRELISELKTFRQNSQMDEKFFRENFVQLGVYFKELRHEQIDQQKAYSIIALLCDIGGSMGLFLGASAMTIFEIVDFMGNKTAVRVAKDSRRKKKKRQLSASSV